jgi:arsenate reductase
MAEAFLRSLDRRLDVSSAGTAPAAVVHPKAIQVMAEIGVAMTGARPKHVDAFLSRPFDYVITVCDNARESCPFFTGEVRHRLHFGFDDPAGAAGTDPQILDEFRRVRDLIRTRFTVFYREDLLHRLTTPPL